MSDVSAVSFLFRTDGCASEAVDLLLRAKRQNHVDKQGNAFWGHLDVDFFSVSVTCFSSGQQLALISV